MNQDDSDSSIGGDRAPLIAFVAGAGVMLVEVTAPRLMQPWFGASVFVWTNVIGVMMLALALGYRLGGSLAEKPRLMRRIAGSFVVAGAWTCVLPFLVAPFSAWLLPEPTSLLDHDQGPRTLELGSLVTAAVLMAPPVFLLALVSPQLVRASVDAGTSAGPAAGRVFTWERSVVWSGRFFRPTGWCPSSAHESPCSSRAESSSFPD